MSSSESQLLELFHKISGYTLIVTFIVNYTLIYLTLFHAPNLFGTYRHFIITSAVFGILFSSLEFLVKPTLYLNKNSVTIFSLDFFFIKSDSLSTWMLAFFTGFHCSMLSLISIQFLYRYWSISSSVLIFESSRFAYWILSIIFGGFLWSIFTFEVISCDLYQRTKLKFELETVYKINSAYLNCLQLEVKDSNGNVQMPGTIFLIIFTTLLLIKLSVMLACGLKMAFQVYKRSNFRSSRHHKQHSLFLKSVFIQLLAPVIILYLPTFGLSYLPFMKTVHGVVVPILTVYPVIDSVIVLYIVSDYRITFRHGFNRIIWFLRGGKDIQMEAPINMSNLFSSF